MQLLLLMITSLFASAQVASAQNDAEDMTHDAGPVYFRYLGVFALYFIGALTLWLTSKLYHSKQEYGSLHTQLKHSRILAWFCITPSSDISSVNAVEGEQGFLAGLGYSTRLICCFLGLQVSYLSWGFLQERLMTIEYDGERFVHSEALVLVNRMLACVIAIIVNKVMTSPTSFSPPYKYCICSMGNILSSWFQYEALKFVGFPLQVLSKSSKILFAMIMGKIVQEKSFPWSQYGAATVIMAGIAIFKIYDTEDTKEEGADAKSNQAFGALLLLCYVGCDSFTSNYQRTVFDIHKINPYQMMLGINAASCSVLLVMLSLRGVLFEAAIFFLDHPLAMFHACLMSICSASGQLFIFYTIKEFGVVVFSSIMTFRQLLAILLSIVYYGHNVTNGSWMGLGLVFCALGFQIHKKMKK